jgi:hypothetical protein
MKPFEDQSFDKELKSLNNKIRITENEQSQILQAINQEIDRENPSKKSVFSKWKYSIAVALAVFIFILLALPQFTTSDLAGKEQLIGETFHLAYQPVLYGSAESPGAHHRFLTIEFVDGHTVHTMKYGEGTYELTDESFLLQFENENERLQIHFELQESERDFSAYAAKITEVEFEMEDWNEISYFKDFAYSLSKDMPLEFLIE